MINFGAVPAGSVLPIFFDSYAGSTGASITISGLAVTDIEIYKGTSMTQRSSDAGYTLLDTDGIDLDGITGIHGFSIDLGDNTDASFYAAGSFYTVVVSAITVDSQTVNFVAATFRIVAAENTAGTPVADTVRVAGTAQTAGDIIADTNDIQARLPAALVGGRMDANMGAISADATAADNAEAFFDGTGYAGTNNVIPLVTTTTTATNLTNLPTIPANWLTAAGMDATASAEIADAVWDEAISGHLGAGSTGAALNAAGSAGDPWTTPLPGAYGAGTAGYIVGTNLDATVSSRSSLDAAGVRTAVGLATANLDTQLAAIAGYIDTEVGAIYSRLGAPAGASIAADLATIAGYIDTEVAAINTLLTSTGVVLTAAERNAIADAHLDRANAIETGLTVRQAFRLEAAAAAGKLSGAATASVVIRNAVADSKDRITATVDADGNRSAITLDLT